MAITTLTSSFLSFMTLLYIRIPFILKLDTQERTGTGTRSSGQHEAHPSELTYSRSHSTAYLYNRFTVESPAGINL